MTIKLVINYIEAPTIKHLRDVGQAYWAGCPAAGSCALRGGSPELAMAQRLDLPKSLN